MSDSPKRFLISAGLVLVVGIVGLSFAWKYFRDQVEQQRAQLAAAAEEEKRSKRFVDYGQIADFEFTNYDGKNVTRQSMLGKVWVVDFVFTTCAGLCPVMSKAMQGVQEHVAASSDGDADLGSDKLKFVTISTDPDLDTLDRLKSYSERYKADPARWYFVRGDFKAVQDFSQNALKLGLERASAKAIAQGSEKVIHSNKFVLIDGRGHVRNLYTGTIPSQVEKLIEDLPHLIREETAPAK